MIVGGGCGDELFQNEKKIGNWTDRVERESLCHRCSSPEHIYIYIPNDVCICCHRKYHGTFTVSVGVSAE